MISPKVLVETEEKMKKSLEVLKREFTSIRTGRATPALLDRIQVEAYGSQVPIKQIANVSVPEARMIVIQPWDRSLLGNLEKAIQKSDLGINPINDGSGVIRLVFPQLTEERRKELVKVVKKKTEEAKVALRNIRRDVNEELNRLEKDGTASEDEVRRQIEQVQKLTDKYIKSFEETCAAKEKEIMEI